MATISTLLDRLDQLIADGEHNCRVPWCAELAGLTRALRQEVTKRDETAKKLLAAADHMRKNWSKNLSIPMQMLTKAADEVRSHLEGGDHGKDQDSR